MNRRWPSPYQGRMLEFAAWWRRMRRRITDADHRDAVFAQIITVEEAQHWTEMMEGNPS